MKRSKLILIGMGLIILIGLSLIMLVRATGNQQALQDELDNLTANLTSQGYSWLIDYNLSYPYVSVFRQSSSEEVARFENIAGEDWYKVYLTSLGDNITEDTFDLKILGGDRINGDDGFDGVEFDYIVDPYTDTGEATQNVSDCGNLTTANAVYYVNYSGLKPRAY